MKVLVMGLGLHGGGLETAKYLLRHGALVTVTDLRDEKILAPSIDSLDSVSSSVRYVLGKHHMRDFADADMVIKNPGVPGTSPYLQAARRIETDLSLFLADSPARLCAVTGTKGKSTVTRAIHWVLQNAHGPEHAFIGGNITVPPLVFLDDLESADDVVLELSSFQLGDLAGRRGADNQPLLKPKTAVLTAIMSDHMDRYRNMDEYITDKRVIYQNQYEDDFTIAGNDEWGRSFRAESRAQPLIYSGEPLDAGVSGAWLSGRDSPGYVRLRQPLPALAAGRVAEIVPAHPIVPGLHQKVNLLAAGLALLSLGLDPDTIRAGLAAFKGVEHRLEFFHEADGIRYYNDSAATVPQAAAAALAALGEDAGLDGHVVLVTGGTDKNLDFSPLVNAAGKAKAVILLAGTGSEKLRSDFETAGIAYDGPFDSIDKAADAAIQAARRGDCVVLSPGCASFGMFLNEFDRGNKWKKAVVQ
jgi:UDP-N-acetylmuramoylalanine--D-glutamate ligase